ncbi:hypothetical protein BHM03_00006912 [Ensete ventricosum]|nr:hypothetical protein BHM03_00006912 [Ensete ventricosum]
MTKGLLRPHELPAISREKKPSRSRCLDSIKPSSSLSPPRPSPPASCWWLFQKRLDNTDEKNERRLLGFATVDRLSQTFAILMDGDPTRARVEPRSEARREGGR